MSQGEAFIKTKNSIEGRVNPNRRAFIKTAALAGGAAVVTGVPLASYFIAPALKKGSSKWVNFGDIKDLDSGSVAMLSYEFLVKDGWLALPQRGFVWVKNEADDKLTVFSSTCTHMNCNVIWQEEEEVFLCPCHAGRFDAKGQPIAGPPTKPLAVLEHKVEGGKLLALLTF